MFGKILIASRGEIACRVARTARRLGIRTVAVYSEIDDQALHVSLCDEAIAIGGCTPAESYLDLDKMLGAAETCKAEAIHPGYGFLSENPMFSARCEEQNIVFMGPDARTIQLMGAKDQARVVAVRAGIPVPPGYEGEEQDTQNLYEHACNTGFPVLIKATAGGGGKGMRVVHSAADFESALESVKRESLSAFGVDRVLLERYLPAVRHVEVQVFADSHGNVVHLHERDCSMQRRHQKVVEEAPAPGLNAATRKAMTEAAVACTRSIGYLGAGTIEFLLTPEQDFYFLEMNTRIQVEHPITEMITGQDLVEWQFKVHSGEPLPIRQEQITLNGHSMECRIYAENPGNHFLPASGKILRLLQPDPCEGTRIETGIREGDTVSPYYDPMICKLVTWSPHREGAHQRMRDALHEYVVLGLASNSDFLQSLIDSTEFSSGRYDTRCIERNLDTLLATTLHSPLALCCAAAWRFLNNLRFQLLRDTRRLGQHSPWSLHADFGIPKQRRYNFWYRDENTQQQRLDFTYKQDHFTFDLPDMQFSASLTEHSDMLTSHPGIDGPVACAMSDRTLYLHVNGTHHQIEMIDRHCPTETSRSSDRALDAPLSGIVVDLKVECNQNVTEGEVLVVIEAMKMEHSILAPSDGTVQDIYYGKGERVAENAPLLKIAYS